MRQTEADKIQASEAGRSSGRPVSFPDVLLYRGRASDGEECLATFDNRTVLLSRLVGGLPCRIRVSVSQYQAETRQANSPRAAWVTPFGSPVEPEV